MKLKDLLLPAGLTLLTVWAVQMFFFNKKGTDTSGTAIRSGQSFIAPKSMVELKPLNKEIDFIDEKRPYKTVITEVETDLARITFSSDGASIGRFEVKRKLNGKESFINTVFPVTQTEKENRCLLVALNEKTPYYYKFVGKDETDSEINVRYQYSSAKSDLNVNKTYTIFKDTYKVNLKVELQPKRELVDPVQARIFFPSPFTPEVPGGPYSVFVNEKGSVKRTSGTRINEQEGLFHPQLFGADTKYFIHTMVEDQDKFVQRAYNRDKSSEKLFAILEGPEVTKPASWTVSFYFGPKEEVAMARVDDRLFQTLDYSGLLAPIAKVLLSFLKYLYKYVGNYGLAIILLTLLMRLLLLPFTMRAEQGLKKRAERQKKLKYIEQKYKHDREALNRAKVELMKGQVIPGLGGCLPMLLQIPIFFALSRVLSSSIEFYQAPFVFWITDLSARDPYYVLPILVVAVMLLQAFTGDKAQRMMFMIMAVVVGALFINLSAGLGLYIAVSSLLGVLQTTLQRKLRAA